ncbi:lipopolysaccharide/colanic/teichoic acid biosynthesis glycosyltransferase [Ensifer mexicanus]|uniref:Sugar transferase n=1 Tax=Sinorhizobium mexicanum TaxID=375549 RepID=A0A859R062_9HYPH|nr:lipopolysaccharide/colanic/teichoic acid biosynthesis glycosyltransferase [Sinorhizobium mexicanum]QLL65966.1 sugar transferase [Sinorhizobium mexicanum]
MKANLDRVVSVPAWPSLRRSAAFRRAIESLFAAVALVPCLPLMGLTAIVVWINLGRPLLFTQVRAGVGMRVFTILKFRTMTDARGADGELLADELRQTKLTALLRRLRFDELPQLLSILRGDMSLVGPRPLPLATVAAFGELGRLRCLVPPGMTGWAQVNGNTRLSDDQKIALDLWYVGHASLRLDGFILLLTLKTIVLGEKVHRAHLKMAEEYVARRTNLQG